MKVIPTSPSRKSNAAAFRQSPVYLNRKQEYDSVSFGMAAEAPPSIDTLGNYEGKGYEHFANFKVKGHAKIDDIKVDETFTTGSWLEANNLNAQSADIGDYAYMKGEVKAEFIRTGSFFEAKQLDAKKMAVIGTSGKIKGKAKAEILTAGDDIKIGKAEIGTLVSHGNVDLGDIIRLDKLVISKKLHQTTPPTRHLNLKSSRILPEQINVVLDGVQLKIRVWNKSALSKLKFFTTVKSDTGTVLIELSGQALEQLVKIVK